MTTKTLGQVLYEAEMVAERGFILPWESLQAPAQYEYDRMASAVAAVVREQCAQECADYADEAHSIGEYGEAAVAGYLEDAIRSMK